MTEMNHNLDGAILFHYDLYPDRIESYENVKKIYTREGTYALKRTEMPNEQSDWFLHCLDRLYQISYDRYLPLIATKFGERVLSYNGNNYYLTKWVTEHENPSFLSKGEFLAEELGRLHSRTVKNQSYTEEVIRNSYASLIQRYEQIQLEMERFTEVSERKIYMSPFELNYISNFHRLMRTAEEAKQKLNEWVGQCQKEQRFRSVLCHGKPTFQHVVFDSIGEGYLLNFERATLDTPIKDLAVFLRSAVQSNDWNESEALDWMRRYEKHLQLFEEEKVLLTSYLYFPEPVFSVIRTYEEKRNDYSQLELVRKLNRKHNEMKRLISFGNKFMYSTSTSSSSTDSHI